MLRLSKLADYSVVILATMARAPQELITASALSEKTTLPAPTVAKLLKKMAKHGLLNATRGAAGGYRLSKSPDKITMKAIIEVVDGPIKITGCTGLDKEICGHEEACAIYGRWDPINEAIQKAFASVMLADILIPLGEAATEKPCSGACVTRTCAGC